MKQIQDVVLELVRPGPAHNQLLSPLTTYVALCGGGSPVSIHIPFEHQQLLTRIQRLRYETDSAQATEAQIAQRQAELDEMGGILGNVLGTIPTLLAELNRVRCTDRKLTHLRLSMSASELGMIPFETALSPSGFPGNGSPLFLQSHAPITLTREIRRGFALPLNWNQKPKILFAFASPQGVPPVPYEAHLKSLRDAIAPWVHIKDDPEQSVHEVKKILTLLPNASLQEIRELCNRENFTHVHILAHGAPFKDAVDRHFGLMLCNDKDKSCREIVDGESLAIALTGSNANSVKHEAPTVVSLATCDSGNVGSVLTPGGSIAHELHSSGIPWVIASQFPLWMSASSLAVSELFSGLLAGEDPRSVLYDLRRRLRTDCPKTHDWASIVAYATIPPDFESQLTQFRDEQMREKLSVKLNRLDELIGKDESNRLSTELKSISETTRQTLNIWCKENTEAHLQRLKPTRSMRLCMGGASEKRLGVAYLAAKKEDGTWDAFRKGREYYSLAVEADPSSTWPITQYLFMNALFRVDEDPGHLPFGIEPKDWWFIANRMAMCEIDTPRGSFALTDMVELTLLGCLYNPPCDKQEAQKKIDGYIKQILHRDILNPVPKRALRHQLQRYKYSRNKEVWGDMADEALKQLGISQ
ncbi:MAG TPA: CHAT domain-containing protein [Gallionella sp.]|nr:CHAT domain-containing protein [Gallionella sp.]